MASSVANGIYSYGDPQGFNNIQDFIPESPLGYLLITSKHANTLALADEAGRIELPRFHSKTQLIFWSNKALFRMTDVTVTLPLQLYGGSTTILSL